MANPQDLSIIFSSAIMDIQEHNSSFDKGVLKVCYKGRNRNGSSISKEVFEQCMPSIYNCPIVCRYDRETDTIGSHDVELVRYSDGSMRLINITHPVGMIPQGANYWWQDVVEDGGQIHEYLFVEALLWKRQEAYKKIKEDGVTDESMEISIKEGSMVNGVYVISRFEFTAFCLLGTAEPCYESASLEVFSQDKFRAELDEMVLELKQSFSAVQTPENGENIKNKSKGGRENLDEQKLMLLKRYGYTIDSIEFSIDDETIESLTEKLKAQKEREFVLAGQVHDAICEALTAVKVTTEYGTYARYYYADHDAEKNLVYAYDELDWNLYAFAYTVDGDTIKVDFESAKRQKIQFVDFDEGGSLSYSYIFESITSNAKTVVEAEFEAKKAEYETQLSEKDVQLGEFAKRVEELQEFQVEKIAKERKEAEDSIFAQFEDLNGVEAFEALKAACSELDIETIEEKCFAIRGRTVSAKFTLQDTEKIPKIKVEKPARETKPYGGIFDEYGIVPASQSN